VARTVTGPRPRHDAAAPHALRRGAPGAGAGQSAPAGAGSGARLRVAYVTGFYPCPSHSFIRREIGALEAQGLEVHRFSLREIRELPTPADREERERTRFLVDAGPAAFAGAVLRRALTHPVRLLRAATLALRLGWRSDRGVARHLVYLVEACLLARWLEEVGADHLHAHFGTNATTVAALCREMGGPSFSFTVHGPEEFDKPEFLKLGEKVHLASFVAAVSSYGKAQICRWARHEDWEKIHVVRCGLDEALLQVKPRPAPEARRLVCVGRLSEQKGLLLLVEAAARLKAEGLHFEIDVLGEGPMRPQIERRIREGGLEQVVRLAGWASADAVREAIFASRALVLPSFAEGLPVALMEALALGRPVITTAIAGIPELVDPGVTGWLVPAGSLDELVAAMRAALVAPPERLGEMGRAGGALVARNHDAAREARKLADLFQHVVGARNTESEA
jgi:glycosyltransferase involved in cell wall biosynthesis